MTTEFREQYGPWALIAGGSEGIGLSFAEQLAERGINLILLARRAEPLAQAERMLRAKYAVEIRAHSVDLTAPTVKQALDDITAGCEIGLLIYNAGAVHSAELFHDNALSAAEKLVALNCLGPVLLCHRFGAAMRARRRGGIILLSSMAGFAGGAYNTVYSATKAFDTIFAEGLWAELKPFNVDVLGLVAGATDTPAMANAGVVFGAFTPMSAATVAAEGLAQLGSGPVWVAGEGNRAGAPILRGENRQQAIEFMSMGAAGMFQKPFPIAVD